MKNTNEAAELLPENNAVINESLVNDGQIDRSDSYTPNETFLSLLPEEITIDPNVNIRLPRPAEDMTDEELDESLKTDGQLQPVLLRPGNEPGEVVLVAGHRRRDRIALLNMLKPEGEEPMRVLCVLKQDITAQTALKAAWAENKKRRGMNAIEELAFIGKVRQANKWTGAKGTKKVADYLGVSPAWVTEREKLAGLSEENKARIQSGEMSADASMLLPKLNPDKHDEVVKEGRAKQDQEDAAKGKKTKSPISKANLKKAAREVPGALELQVPAGDKDLIEAAIEAGNVVVKAKTKKKKAAKAETSLALNRKEIVQFFETYRGSIPHNYAVVQDCVTYMLDKFFAGTGTDRTMMAKFDAMIGPACTGKKLAAPVVEEELPVSKAAVNKTHKSAGKSAGGKKGKKAA